MSTVFSPAKQCHQCGYYMNGRKGLYCSKCFNISLVPVKCKFCGEQTLVTQHDLDNENLHVCMKCDWDNRSDLKCDTCGNTGKDALYTSRFRETYKCKSCCQKQLMKCADCGVEFYGPKRIARHPLCHDCRLKNYVPQACIVCSHPFYFHKLKHAETCICNECYRKKHVAE